MQGGTLVYGICFGGWSNGKYKPYIPGDVKVIFGGSKTEKIVDEDHPIVTALYSDRIALTNADLTGESASHIYFDPSTLPTDTNIIMNANNVDKPTLIEYKLGKGTIIASGLTWEYSYDKLEYGMFSRKAFDDLYLYALNMGKSAIDETPGTVISTITLDKEKYKTDDDINIKVLNELTTFKRNAKAVMKITDIKDNTIDTIIETPEQLIIVGSPVVINKKWKLSNLVNGSYKIVIEWYENEELIGTGEGIFTIESDINLSDQIVLFKDISIKSTDLIVKEIVSNPNAEYIAKDLDVVLDIKDVNGEVIWTNKQKISELKNEESTALYGVVPLNDIPIGEYTVSSSIYKSDLLVIRTSRKFKWKKV